MEIGGRDLFGLGDAAYIGILLVVTGGMGGYILFLEQQRRYGKNHHY
jgi:hypothetical protein